MPEAPGLQLYIVHAERDATVLPRIALLFRRRGCRLQSLMLEPAAEPGVDRLQLAAECTSAMAARMEASLRGLAQVISVSKE